jgi:hypothetical protein
MNRNNAAKKIQRAFRKRHPRNNTVALNFIKGSWAVKWYTAPNHKHFSLHAPNVFAQLGNLHPLSRNPKRSKNIKLILIPGRPVTTRPRIKKIPDRNNNNNNNFTRGGLTNNNFVAVRAMGLPRRPPRGPRGPRRRPPRTLAQRMGRV